MKLKPNTIYNISYTNSRNEESERYIIPTTIPGNVKALDVTELEESERRDVNVAYQQYAEYLDQHMRTAYSFEEWCEQVRGKEISPKWRTFKPEILKILS